MEHVSNKTKAKPFLKWAGGKTQLLNVIESILPYSFSQKENITYIEPFVGGGAVLFHLLQKYPNINRAVICDINPHLIHSYQAVKHYPEELISFLKELETIYKGLENGEDQKAFFLKIREQFNSQKLTVVQDAAYMIFLNRTCFNGLYRENSKGAFNVSFGKYTNPTILDANLIRTDSEILQRVEIINGDFSLTEAFTSDYTFIYFDPPYRPISSSSAFTSYNNRNFNDSEQCRLQNFFSKMDAIGCDLLLSNSDGTSIDPTNTYLDSLYRDFIIQRVYAKRSISSSGNKRGPIPELLIRNYP